MNEHTLKKISWVFQILAAVILLQTLRYKFTGAPEAIHIFTTVGMEPHGRIIIGIVELIAGVALLVPFLAASGALVGAGVMVGAIVGHLTVLGVNVQGDGGALFSMAIVVFVSCLVVLYIRRKELPILGKYLE